LNFNPATMKYLFVLVVAFAAAQAFDLDTEWEAFKIKYGKNLLTGQEHDARKNIFANNLKFIEKHNAEHALGLHTYTVGVNQFADLTNEEFVEQYTGSVKPMEWAKETKIEVVGEVPDSIDWREKGAVTPVKNQGNCHSTWAFSAIGTMEGAIFKKTGKLVSLSEQNLVDCSTIRNEGCHGGNPYFALIYAVVNKGIDTEETYPFEGKQSQCRYDENNSGARILSGVQIARGDEEELKKAIGTVGPVSAVVDGHQSSFQLYKSGIYSQPECDRTWVNVCVLAVGYGSENGQDYYIVKNSWGTQWGEEGYIRMGRNNGDQCGIAIMASYAQA